MNRKILNFLLLLSFAATLLVPVTGIIVHKMASTVFLLLCIVHAVINRKRMDKKKYGVLAAVLLAFLSGIFGMIFEEIPLILAMHRLIAIACVFFLAIHIYIWHKKNK